MKSTATPTQDGMPTALNLTRTHFTGDSGQEHQRKTELLFYHFLEKWD